MIIDYGGGGLGFADLWLYGFIGARIYFCTNEDTGLHPVLGYFALSGLSGLRFGAEVWLRV